MTLKLTKDIRKKQAAIRQVKIGFTCETGRNATLEIAGDNSAGLEGSMLVWENEEKELP